MIRIETQKKIDERRNREGYRQNLRRGELLQIALQRQEGVQILNISADGEVADGALSVTTGEHTARSANDKYIVDTGLMAGHVRRDNKAMTLEEFGLLRQDAAGYLAGSENPDKLLISQDFYIGADPIHRRHVRLLTESAWSALFASNLFIRPDQGSVRDLERKRPDILIMHAPTFQTEPAKHHTVSKTAIALEICKQETSSVVIAGTEYAGEIKKSAFSAMHRLLSEEGVVTMHCSATEGNDGDVALFFGLSGTGKTTLSADAKRQLIGDDEHYWYENGIANLEGGCYAKVINIDPGAEPDIYQASRRRGSILENVVLDEETREPKFEDGLLTENTRAAYPLSYIQNHKESGMGGHPSHIILLSADATGVLPPTAKLTSHDMALYWWLSGYTSKMGSTEKGVAGVKSDFSPGFDGPFMPEDPLVYAELLRKKLDAHNPSVWLINTGWVGGSYASGTPRMPLPFTRELVSGILSGELDRVAMDVDPLFGFAVPRHQVIREMRWVDQDAYRSEAAKLADNFRANFTKQFAGSGGEHMRSIEQAGPANSPIILYTR